MNSKIIYNVHTKTVSITNRPIVEESDIYINLKEEEDELHVMLIEDHIATNSALVVTTVDNFYATLHEYIEKTEMTGKYVVKISTMRSDKYVVRGVYHLFGPELCKVCLYKIRKQPKTGGFEMVLDCPISANN